MLSVLQALRWDKDINDEMKSPQRRQLLNIKDGELNADYIIPTPLDTRVTQVVAAAVAQSARDTGVARI